MIVVSPRPAGRQPKTDPVACVTLHPDGSRVFVGGAGGTIAIWDISSQRSVGAIDRAAFDGDLLELAISPRGRTLVAVVSTGIATWDLEDGNSSFAVHPTSLRSADVRFGRDGSIRALTTAGSDCHLWDLTAGRLLASFEGTRARVRRAMLSRDGHRVLAFDADGSIRAWDVETGNLLAQHRRAGHADQAARVMGATFHPDGRRALSATLGDTIVFDIDTGEILWHVSGPSPDVETALFHPDDRHALLVAHNGAIDLIDLHSGRSVRSFPGTRRAGKPLALCPDNRTMICRSEDGLLWRAIDIETGSSITAMKAHSTPIRDAIPHPDGALLVTAGADEPIMVSLLETGAPTSMLGRSRDSGTIGGGPVAVSQSGAQALSAHEDGSVNLWDTRRGTCVRVPIAGGPVRSMAMHHDERHALVAIDTRVEIWDLLLMLRVDAIELKSKVTALACFSHRLYAASHDFRLRVWDLSSGRNMLAIDTESPGNKPALNGWMQWIAFTEVTGEIDPAPGLRVLHMDTGELLGQLSFDKGAEIYLVALHDEGEVAIVAGADTAHVWDVRHRAWRHSVQLPDCYFIHTAIEPRGEWALLVHRRGVAVWDLASGEVSEEWRAEADVMDAAIGGDGTIAVSCSDGGVFLLRTGDQGALAVAERLESFRTTIAGIADTYRAASSRRSSGGAAGREEALADDGNLVWIEAFRSQVDELDPAPGEPLSTVLARLDSLVDEVEADPSYSEPEQARRRVRSVIEKYRAS